MTNPSPNTPSMSQPTSTPFKVGDRVRVAAPHRAARGMTGVVTSEVYAGYYTVHVAIGIIPDMGYDASELEPFSETDELITLAKQLGAVEHDSWIDAGLLCRRYTASDGSIDLTVRVP